MPSFFLASVPAVLLYTFVALRLLAAVGRWRTRRRWGVAKDARVVAFFHPYADSGGGGERVLWRAVHALSRTYRTPAKQSNVAVSTRKTEEDGNSGESTASGGGKAPRPLHILIYTGDDPATGGSASKEAVLQRVQERFQLDAADVSVPLDLVYMRGRWLLEARRYPVFTMLGQSLGSLFLALEALLVATPDVFFDSTGFAFSFLPARLLAGCRVGAYVHYPTISTDMLQRVRALRPSYNNKGWITSSGSASSAKLLYYWLFSLLYALAGAFAQVVMVNSNWTRKHIEAMWRLSPKPIVVFPPCDTGDLASLPIDGPPPPGRAGRGGAGEGGGQGGREAVVLSVGQFRPEKDQALQLHALAELRKLGARGSSSSGGSSSSSGGDDANEQRCTAAEGATEQEGSGSSSCSFDHVKLVVLGSCRNEDDERLLQSLQALARELGIKDSVEFVVNCPFSELKAWLGRASVGMHSMWNEHFGIGVVEMMAAGLVTVAHNSGGPKEDIVVDDPVTGRPTGCLAETPLEYATLLAAVFDTTSGKGNAQQDIRGMRQAARDSVGRFSNEVFDQGFVLAFLPLLEQYHW